MDKHSPTPIPPSLQRGNKGPKERDKYFKIRNILNIIFIVLVLVTIGLYFIFPLPDGLPLFFSSCLVAIMVKAVELYLRVSVSKFRKS